MLLAKIAGALASSSPPPSPCSISGDLGASDSTVTVTGAVRTVTAPAGNSGVLRFADLSFSVFGNISVNVNGGGWDLVFEGAEYTWISGQSIQMRCRLEDAFTSGQVGVYDKDTGTLLQVPYFERTT
ncbi:MAG: hypothetical protein KJZ75_11120 [Hyphomonadaceae bacterium]|nr:hypothetical protein [Hyphomonadaceae bacterium]